MVTNLINWQQEAHQYLIQNKYQNAISLYEEAIATKPNIKAYYWSLGLLLLLEGQEAEAQMTWMLPLAEVEQEEIEVYTNELIQVLLTEAERREKLGDVSNVWLIRQHIREIKPDDIDNLLKTVLLSIHLKYFEGTELTEWGVIEVLQTKKTVDLDIELLLEVLKEVLDTIPLHSVSLELAEALLSFLPNTEQCFFVFLSAAIKIGHSWKKPGIAARILELYLQLDPHNIEALRHLALFHQDAQNFSQGIQTAKLCHSLSQELADKIFSAHLVLRGLMSAGGYWDEVNPTCQELELLLKEFVEAQPLVLDELKTSRLLTPAFAIPHIKDDPKDFRTIYNQVAKIFQKNVQSIAKEQGADFIKPSSVDFANVNPSVPFEPVSKPLKIGYLSYAFRSHSVGWLARWLFQHHNREKFEIHQYFVNYQLKDDWLQQWYVEQAIHAHKFDINGIEIAQKIHDDEIDILIDLDSITLDITSQVVALKPAPVQVTWLGWDASGIPAVDYYIADPYVLPESAQDYYSEKIWRLPQTYIAVDGFEVGIPTLRRDNLDIPSDAVVYLSAQRGYKRHPETTKWQMKILKEVPNSYLLIKGLGEQEAIRYFFYKIAEEEGVDCSRLRFLPQVALEANHRANLGIADVVLDTYPYNGATTTLETLWMGIPIVTRVGEQFVARNSYTMMMNAGIKEGIAWTDEEYIEWGIRLGKDTKLRQEIFWKLRQSRQTAPLWNGKQFTREMEKAYEQMWQNYIKAS